jgi:hypothetical protein
MVYGTLSQEFRSGKDTAIVSIHERLYLHANGHFIHTSSCHHVLSSTINWLTGSSTRVRVCDNKEHGLENDTGSEMSKDMLNLFLMTNTVPGRLLLIGATKFLSR